MVVTQDYWENNVPANHTQPIITDYGTHVDVRVYDVSDVLVGSAVELGSKSLTGSFMSGGSYANKTIIATDTFVDTWVLTKELMRSEPQYCGLNASSYKDLALTTAQSKVENFAKQMIGELELVNDCSNIFQVSTMHEDSTDDEHLRDFHSWLQLIEQRSHSVLLCTLARCIKHQLSNGQIR